MDRTLREQRIEGKATFEDVTNILTVLVNMLPSTKLEHFNKWLDVYIFYIKNKDMFGYPFNYKEVASYIKGERVRMAYERRNSK